MSNVISMAPYTARASDIETAKEYRDWLISTIASIETKNSFSDDLKLEACNGIHDLFEALIDSTLSPRNYTRKLDYPDQQAAEREAKPQKRGGF
ncbi:MAG: hypothetical protein E6X23_20385 [Mixta calida]|uniref:hypothetical protein n=1 Tax=Mixta calida TaxID=665913 RepID=UPI002913B01E|nr:hypothetical protein [Mixta calida]MDU4943863.1 hypothetical protein [Mixta calida]